MYAQDNNSLPVWIILSQAHHHISINSQPFLVGIVSRSLDEEAKVVVVGVLLGYWSSAGELLHQLQDVHGTKKQKTISHYQFRKAIALALLDPDRYWPNCIKSKPVQNENKSSVSGTKASSK